MSVRTLNTSLTACISVWGYTGDVSTDTEHVTDTFYLGVVEVHMGCQYGH